MERSGSYLGSDPVSTRPLVVKTAKMVRRVGYTVAVLIMVWLSIPIILGAYRGALSGDAHDPYTGRPLIEGGPPSDCEGWGAELVGHRNRGRLEPGELEVWREACGSAHPEVDALLSR